MLISLKFDPYLNTLNVDTKQHNINSGCFLLKIHFVFFVK